ncbi:unnamed protein product [Acanthoscelides obtectus]|uniref:Uncharacterized protein n=1 Tax=Acanthoscelides obtectus TaxID=200917 RepID=A0A9P0P6P5_ACAOB|nr:unnamed protein product [Acanthoscelides obtectus]CAK1666579.1 hypothetical protein AOBTE_LOCUS25380 [Acanthoscelides obtectus]
MHLLSSIILKHVNWWNLSLPYYTFFCSKPSQWVRMYIIGNTSKFYTIYDGKEMPASAISIGTNYIVDYYCKDNKPTVIIATRKKERDEKVIQEAIKSIKGKIQLPSPSQSLHCSEEL